ncbi:putative Subtilisin [Candidatus Promineifilum breve]|uniref:Subtilisin n=1 Tax=Candidatus Promineifilum breve TaxID=1806508 RepID=A0A170PDQ6_9CHLR|nr:S8 family serine peptidase [Candidatus Promineifilum breve]CUS02153.2 putative Subtilisin [Candidatus Promineifilum breve]
MSARPAPIFIACLAAGAALFLLLRLMVVATAQPESYPPDAPSATSPGDSAAGMVDVIIRMEQAADLSASARIGNSVERRGAIIDQLKSVAAASQAPLLAELTTFARAGRVQNVRSFWIINAIAATVTPELAGELTARPGVANVALDQQHEAFGEPAVAMTDSGGAPDFRFAGLADAPTAEAGEAANWSIDAMRAPAVWNLLGNDGAGVTVAIVDTGVDWQHPALRQNYRGGRGETAVHHGNWYNTVQPTQTVPVDFHGHGTHVAGTAVGHKGIGVAPGANWIAVAIADEHGIIRDSNIHAAFEWLLAPGGDPALAPDVVNNSWGSSGAHAAFLDDVRVLDAAGIVAVFAAGNSGPGDGSINAPASYPGAISVAATDATGAVTWFSSHGPSPLTAEPKPLLSAPGAQILSSYPNERYALMNGTSMATPHVTGAVALMLSAEPRLSPGDVKSRLAAAAGNPVHDPARGWGQLDAYAAVAPLAAAGTLAGRISDPTGAPVAATITVTTPAGRAVTLVTDPQGRYEVKALPGRYDLQAAAYAYSPGVVRKVEVIPGHVVVNDVELEFLPAGNLSLQLSHAGSGEQLQGALRITTADGRPVPEPARQPDGRYAMSLPTGQYQVTARVPGFRLGTVGVTIAADQTHAVDVALTPGPRLLLIDSGPWQYRSQAAYYDQALEDNNYFADRWSITNPYAPLPTVQQLAAYDVILWSAPNDSPGYLGANGVISDYLGLGGRLLIAGQNVANYDGVNGSMALWWSRHLKAKWLADSSPADPLHGAPDTPFAAHQLTLNGADSAGNQTAPDRVAPRDGSLTQPVLLYPDGTAAALLSRRCEPFRLLYFGFSLEGVSGRAARAALMQTTLDVLLGPDDPLAAIWQPAEVTDFALGGDQHAYTATLRNLNPVLTQTFAIEAGGGWWPRAVLTPTLTIPPCGAADTVVTVDVPAGQPPDSHHEVALTARGPNAVDSPTPIALSINHKTPGYVLIVDDDRFIHTESVYKQALDELGMAYDVWETGWPFDLRGSPSFAFLREYELVIWFTGYDWFQALTHQETAAITDYLEHGGRLFLSSQDFLFRHHDSALARDYLGVVSYQESITPTVAFFDERLGAPPQLSSSQPLTYGAYQNYSDGLAPSANARPFLWHNQGAVAATAAGGTAANGRPWRAVFWALPFETLPAGQQTAAMEAVLGYLSDLGNSTFTVDRRSGPVSESRVYSLVVANEADVARRVWVTNTLPISLSFRGSAGDWTYDRAKRQLTWSGVMAAGEERSLTYTAAAAPTNDQAHRIDNSVTIGYAPLSAAESTAPFNHLSLTKTATTWIDAPDLTTSSLSAAASGYIAISPKGEPFAAQLITYTMVLRNSAATPTRPMTATLTMPQSLGAIEESVAASQGEFRLEAWRAIWRGTLLPGETMTASVTLTRTAEINGLYPAVAYLDDGTTTTTLHPVFFDPLAHRTYLPVAAGWP